MTIAPGISILCNATTLRPAACFQQQGVINVLSYIEHQVARRRGSRELFRRLAERGNPADGNGQDVENQVRAILADVRERGDQALIERTRQFDAPDIEPPLAVPQEELARAAASISGEERSVIVEAASHIRTFHEAQKDKSWFITREDGSILGQKIEPVDRAGLYVPGGKGGNTPSSPPCSWARFPRRSQA